MTDQDAIKSVLDQWLTSLDSGNLQGMLDTCDPEVITANDRTPTTIGVEAVATKYGPRIEAADFQSSFDIEHMAIYGDFAIVMGYFDVTMINKQSGEKGGGSGRLALGYRRHPDGSWKMVLDMDNNA